MKSSQGRSRGGDGGSVASTKTKQEVRSEIITYIREERDTILKKWMALREQIDAEDRRKEQFEDRLMKHKNKLLPLNVVKFIGSLKRSVHHTIRHKGGTTYSIIRSLFIYWDSSKMGLINAKDLCDCMTSLQIKVTVEECREIVSYYSGGKDKMDYNELLKDLQQDEPSMLAYVEQAEEEKADANQPRFETVSDKFTVKPKVVKQFVVAFREYVNKLLRNEGGTPEQHVRWLFQFFDYNFSGGLNVDDLLRACKRKLKLIMSREDAQTIVTYYDRKFNGDIDYQTLKDDICRDVKPIMQFTEMTHSAREKQRVLLDGNKLIPVPFRAPANKVLVKFKEDCKHALRNKVNKHGGSVASWTREAFVFYDPAYTRKMSNVEDLIGAAKRIGIELSVADARTLMACYDVHKTGEMHYEYLTKEIIQEGGSFLTEKKFADEDFHATSRQPPIVSEFESKLKRAVAAYVSKSKGKLFARDVFRGSFARFDHDKSGRLDLEGVKNATESLGAPMTDNKLKNAILWFDTNGSNTLDYNAMTAQYYGEDVASEHLVLPSLKLSGGSTNKSIGTLSQAGTTGFGVKNKTLEKNLEVIESPAVKLARQKINRHKILHEKVKVERKLASIEEQRQAIIDDFKLRRGKG